MHPGLCRELVQIQLEEARKTPGLFGPTVGLEEVAQSAFYVHFHGASGAARLIRFECTNYDFQAMEIEPVDPNTREPLQEAHWIKRGGGAFPTHPRTGRQFLCMPGVRSFYTYPGHDPLTTNEPWEKHRPEFRIVDMIRAIAQRFATGAWT